jgi:SAM-dependent methyltransferase
VKCRICENTSLEMVVDFGMMPLAGFFPKAEEKGTESLYHLDLWHCSQCGVVQVGNTIERDTLFRDYRYKSSVGLSGHFEEVAEMLIDRHSLTPSSSVVEVGSNDGVFLVPMMERGIMATGFEPSCNISAIAKSRGATVVNDYFSDVTVGNHLEDESVDMVVACNCMAHVPDLMSVVRGIGRVLKDGAVAVVEVQYVRDLVEGMQYDFIYHEHCYYHSVSSISMLFRRVGMGLESVERISIHGGSVRLTYRKGADGADAFIAQEREVGLFDFRYFESFGARVRAHIKASREGVERLAVSGSVAGYGASGRANILTNMCELTPAMVDFIVDDSPERAGRFTAKTHVPIVQAEHLREHVPDSLVIFAWTYADMIMKKISGLDVTSYVLFPEFRRLG